MAKKTSILDRFKRTLTALSMAAGAVVTPTVSTTAKKDEHTPLPESSKDSVEEDMKQALQSAMEDVALSFRRDEAMIYKAYGITHKGSYKIKFYKDENGNVIEGNPELNLEEIKHLTPEEEAKVSYLQGAESALHFSRDPNDKPLEIEFDGVVVRNGEVVNNIVVKKEIE